MKLTSLLLLCLVLVACGQTGRPTTSIPSSSGDSSSGLGSGIGSLGSMSDTAKTLSEMPSSGDEKTDSVVKDSATALQNYADTAEQTIQASQNGSRNQAYQYAQNLDTLRTSFGPLVDRLNDVGMANFAAYFSALLTTNPIWRFYRTNPNRHIYTADLANTLPRITSVGYVLEGIAFLMYRNAGPNRVAVKQCVNSTTGIIFLSHDPACEGLATQDWGILGYAAAAKTDASHVPMYRAWNPADNDIVSSMSDVEVGQVRAGGYQVIFQGFWVPAY